MKDLITDIPTIERLAQEADEENWDFRQFIKSSTWGEDGFDGAMHAVAAEVTRQIDCTACAHCCRTMLIAVSHTDIERLSKRLGITPGEFQVKYVSASEHGEMILADQPCPFLEGNLCSVYEDRPDDCRSFPNLHHEDMWERTFAILSNAAICPIVFNSLERVKQIAPWRPRRRR